MKIAFLMQCHKNPEQINLLLKALKHPQVDVFIHVDSKNENTRENIASREGVYLLPKEDCIAVQWGQFSQVKATLNMLKIATSSGGGYSHYFLISGQDFILKSIDDIVEFLENHKEDNFIECESVESFEKRNDIYFPTLVVGKKNWQKIIKSILVYSTGGWNHTFRVFKRPSPYNVDYFFGSSWWCLNEKMILWIEKYLRDHPTYQAFFEKSLCADECFFQTLVMNSPYSLSVRPFLHFVKFENGESSPILLTMNSFSDMQESGKLIARKFDINVDAEVIRKLCCIIKMN